MKFSSNDMLRYFHSHSIKVGDLETAAELKRSREYGKCINVLKSIEQFGDEEDKLIASYELGIIYSQLGLHKHADKSLSKVGFAFKLSPSILCPDLSQSSNKCSSVQNKVAVFDEVLSKSLLIALRSAFAENSPFWTEHGYPTTQFFSYNVPLDNNDSKTEPKHTNHLLKELVSVIRPLVAMSFPEKRIEEAESMEWWCHIRSDSSVAAHQLHFDLDEIALANKLHSDFEDEDGESIHPLVSSVLYLNECCANLAPTLLTNQTLDENSVASEAWLCQPAENRLLLFDGDFLHGVVPYLSLEEQAAPSAPRITLMIGWWGPGVHKSKPSAAKTGLGPNMSMPAETTGGGSSGYSVSNWHIPGKTKSTTAIAPPAKYHCPYLHTDVTWPALLKTESRQSETSCAVERPVLHVVDGPVWVPVRRAPTITALRRRHSKYPRDSACGEERIKKKSKRCSIQQSQSINSGNSSSGISGNSSEAMEYMSIAELNALRSGASVDRKSETQPKRKVNVDADAQEYMSISELNKLRGSQQCSTVAKQKKDKKLRADVVEASSSSDAVEYMTMEMLAQLRGGGAATAPIPVSGQTKESPSASLKSFPPHQSSSTSNRLVERRERRLERRAAAKESVLFFGRWFLQSPDEIYRDIVDGVANNTHNH